MTVSGEMSVGPSYRHRVAKRRRDRWATGPAVSLPEAAYGGPVYDLAEPDPALAWVTFPDRVLEVEGRVLAYTDRAVLFEWGFGQAADCVWLWRDAASAHASDLAGEQAPQSTTRGSASSVPRSRR